MSDTIVQATNLTKQFERGQVKVMALEDVDLAVARGEFVALMGPSGSGKSTLLHLIAGMDKPTAGRLLVLGEEPANMGERSLAALAKSSHRIRLSIFQPDPGSDCAGERRTAAEADIASSALNVREMSNTALKLVALEDRMDHFPRQLSGGQEQRVAIARAIVTDPDIILADEPTGNLDANSAHDVLSLLQKLNKEFGKTIVMVTHDPHSAAAASRLIHLDKGKFVEAEPMAAAS